MAEMFDEAELMDRVDDDIEFLGETIEMLVSDGPELLGRIRDAIGAGDAETVGSQAHALKGMISNFCAEKTQAFALELERIGRSGDLSGASTVLAELEDSLGSLIGELTEFVKGRA